MMRRLAAAFLSTTVLAAGCAALRKDAAPDWVAGPSATYPDTRYLIGRGQADDQELARDRARADLAKVLEAAVSVETTDVTSFSTKSERGAKPLAETQVTRNIVVRTEQIVQGIQIADLWQDTKTRKHWALAVLSRPQASAALRQEIERLDSATRAYVLQARNAPDLLQQAAAANQALESQIERDAAQKTLRVIDSTGRGVEPEFNSGRLAADLDTLLNRMRMRPQLVPDSVGGLEGMLAGAMSAAGFVPTSASDAPYVLTGSLRLDDLGLAEGWYWTRGTLEVQILDVASGKVRGNKRWEIKTSGQHSATARRRALDQADETLKRELRATILGFATGRQ